MEKKKKLSFIEDADFCFKIIRLFILRIKQSDTFAVFAANILAVYNTYSHNFEGLRVHWASKETYHFFRATHTKIHCFKINNIWTQISFNTP